MRLPLSSFSRRILWILLLMAFSLPGINSCTPVESQSRSGNPPRQDPGSFYRIRSLNVIYGDDTYRNWAEGISASSFRMKITAQVDDSCRIDSLAYQPIMLVGTPESNQLLAGLGENLPVSFGENSFTFQGREFGDDDDLCVLSFIPNPYNEQFPMMVVTGNNDAAIIHFLENPSFSGRRGIPLSRWNYQIFRGKTRVALGRSERGSGQELSWDFSDQFTPVHTSSHFRLFAHGDSLSQPHIRQISEEAESVISSVTLFLGKEVNTRKFDYHIYSSAQNMGLITNEMVHAYASSPHEVHTIVNEDYYQNSFHPEASLLIESVTGEIASPAIREGLNIFFSPRWQKKGHRYWASRLFESNNTLTLNQLLDREYFEQESPLIRGAMAGSMIDFLMDQWGEEIFRENFAAWQPSKTELDALESPWKIWLKTRQIPADPPTYASPGYQKGMTFAHEGYSVYDGYGSELAHQSLEKIQSIGGNAISLIPYTGTREKNQPHPFGFSTGAGGENDASLVHAFHAAQRMGMKVMLKPQVYVRGGWPGDVEMENEADWQKFFDYYRRWIRHYAMLAEIHEMDIFCVGVEFLKATTSHPEEWRELIRDIRRIYHGPVTYAANWGEEFDKLAFADELDFVGIDCYYPLSSKNKPSKNDLKAGFQKALENIEKNAKKFNKPVVLTEVGFRSIETPWQHPHAEAGDIPYHEPAQALCYEIVLEGIQKQSWCMGLYWWKWPSFMDYSQRNATSFTPCGKEAEEVLRKYYQAMP